MLTRRNFQLALSSVWFAVPSTIARSQDDETVTVRIRVDETVSGLLQPIELKSLSVEPDHSEDANKLANQTPPGRAIPIILIIVGAIALVRLLEMIQELYRKTYYGGVLINTWTTPPTITNDLRIPANMVFVINRDGTTTQFMGEKFQLGELTAALSTK
jgi:hypothetical protein